MVDHLLLVPSKTLDYGFSPLCYPALSGSASTANSNTLPTKKGGPRSDLGHYYYFFLLLSCKWAFVFAQVDTFDQIVYSVSQG